MGAFDGLAALRGLAYANGAGVFSLADYRKMIADNPTTITRSRKTHLDQFRAETVTTAGPYTVRIDPFRMSRATINFDEKGTNSPAMYVLIAADIPTTVNADEPLFALNDRITDADANTYRVTGVPRWSFAGAFVEVNLELVA